MPCIRCNERVKFRDLLATARDLGASALATGHYVRRRRGLDGAELHRAATPPATRAISSSRRRRAELDFLRFPLGGLAKDETRALARDFGLAGRRQARQPGHLLCAAGLLRAASSTRLRPEAGEPGDIVDRGGHVLGRHRGIAHFTVGQRKGLGIAAAEPLYVLRVEPETRRVVVGPRGALAETRVAARRVQLARGTARRRRRHCG